MSVRMCHHGCGRPARDQAATWGVCEECAAQVHKKHIADYLARRRGRCQDCGGPTATKESVRCWTCALKARALKARGLLGVCERCGQPFECTSKHELGHRRFCGRSCSRARCTLADCLGEGPHWHCQGDGTGPCGIIVAVGVRRCEFCEADLRRRVARSREVA